jgi:hypothetical protein
MMKQIAFLLLLGIISFGAAAQVKEKDLKKMIELAIPVEGGANGANVVWHPIQKKYYAAMAGNVSFYLGVYSSDGKRLSSDKLEAGFDIRGLWYNPKSKSIQMNGYRDYGWAEYVLASDGIPKSVKKIFEETEYLLSAQSAGAYNSDKNVIYSFNEDGEVELYDGKDGSFLELLLIKFGTEPGNVFNREVHSFEDEYNVTTLIFTGIAGAELGLLNHKKHQIELYNASTGYMTRIWRLPEEAPVSDWLNFSFSNGICFLFDKEARIWYGYK